MSAKRVPRVRGEQIWAIIVLTMLVPLASCWHTDPIGYEAYGAPGPRVPATEARLALTGHGVQWVDGGKAIVYLGDRCLTREPSATPIIPSMRLLPASGGSAIWERCEEMNSYRRPVDSVEAFGSIAMDAAGRVLYTICTWPNSRDLNCQNSGHVQLWQTDSGAPYTRRKLLAELYHVVLGVPPDPVDHLNNVSDVHWASAGSFVARGFNTHPFFGDATLGLVVGHIDSAGASFVVLPNTANVQSWALARGGSTIVAARSGLAIEELAMPSGLSTAVAAIPQLPGRGIASISCRASTCLVVTNDVGAPSIFWQVGLTNRRVVQLGTYSGTVSFAGLSPASDAVVFARGSSYYLLEDAGLDPTVH